ncbi:hypothetical protein Agabi119p4_10577 [Agaricus bisporus var. burnettii]|uniref:Uncharacterized protein n=1 Tax=Agaricus bisporus var. burnettii TaxID=192524 RepID=A0A8H7EWD5_AGABI|nr:hypothetical protein Agabi119p4_10577 [Agaricus bisporus var. burnettii]
MDPPNYAEGQFEQLRLNLAQAMGLTEQKAVAQLTTLWRQRNLPAQQNGPPAAPPQPPNNPPGPAAPLLIRRSLQKERKVSQRFKKTYTSPPPESLILPTMRSEGYETMNMLSCGTSLLRAVKQLPCTLSPWKPIPSPSPRPTPTSSSSRSTHLLFRKDTSSRTNIYRSLKC